jgi:hypothetical protein
MSFEQPTSSLLAAQRLRRYDLCFCVDGRDARLSTRNTTAA